MSHLRIMFRQILPNLVSLLVVSTTLQVARVITLESFLSFLGLGVQPPTHVKLVGIFRELQVSSRLQLAIQTLDWQKAPTEEPDATPVPRVR